MPPNEVSSPTVGNSPPLQIITLLHYADTASFMCRSSHSSPHLLLKAPPNGTNNKQINPKHPVVSTITTLAKIVV